MSEVTAAEKWIAALLRERENYIFKGLADRVKQVEAELDRFGWKGEPAKVAPKEAASAKPSETR